MFRRLVEVLPSQLRVPVEAQVSAYNLVQREVDGRALNFYRKKRFKVVRGDLPRLPVQPGVVKLCAVTLSSPSVSTPIHATMHAVDGYFFCLSFSQDLRPFSGVRDLVVAKVSQSWRSNLLAAGEAPPP